MGKRSISPERVINECIRRNIGKLPQVLNSLIASAVRTRKVTCPSCSTKFDAPGGGDVKAQIYLMNRVMGTPKVDISVETKAPSVTGDELFKVQEAVMARQIELLGEYGSAEGDIPLDGEFREAIDG